MVVGTEGVRWQLAYKISKNRRKKPSPLKILGLIRPPQTLIPTVLLILCTPSPEQSYSVASSVNTKTCLHKERHFWVDCRLRSFFSYDKVAIATLLHTMMQNVGNHIVLMHLSKLKMDVMTSAWHNNQTVYCSIYLCRYLVT